MDKKNSEQLRLYPGNTVDDIIATIPDPTGLKSQRTLINCLEYVVAQGCNAVVFQDPVQDPDYLGEYLAFYSKLFIPIYRYCQRLHFFRTAPQTDEDPLQYVDRVATNFDSYIGFLTLRPIRWAPVGATFLPVPSKPVFAASTDKFPVRIAGCKFEVNATPFMQQDNAVGACAQASIWMALRALRSRMGNSAFDPAQITTAATRFLITGRTNPGRDGLHFPQMIEAVRSAGHIPLPLQFDYHEKTDEEDQRLALLEMRRKIYPYVESGIPTILVLQREEAKNAHAVLALGHKWDPTPATKEFVRSIYSARGSQATVSLLHAATWTPGFLIHNDNTGPYREFQPRGDDLDVEFAMEDLRFMLVPLPPDVLITAQEAEEIAVQFIGRMLEAMHGAKSEIAQFNPVRVSDKLVLRPYLIGRHEFRQWALKEPRLPEAIRRHYRMLPFPKRLWVFELNLTDGYSEAPNNKGCRVGEILIDPSGDTGASPYLAAHLNVTAVFEGREKMQQEGIFSFRMDWTKEDLTFELVSPDQTYLPHVHT